MISDILGLIVSHITASIPDAEARRAWVLRVDGNKVDDLPKPQITVVFVKHDKENITKGDRETVVSSMLVLQKKIAPQKMNDTIDPLVKIMESLYGEFMSPVLIESESMAVVCRISEEATRMPLYDTDRLLKRNEFLGMIPVEAIVTTDRT